MCCKNFYRRIIPFAIALAIGLLAANFLYKENIENKTLKQSRLSDKLLVIEGDGDDVWSGVIACEMNGFNEKSESVVSSIDIDEKPIFPGDFPLEIISETKAQYTKKARQKETQGKVILRATFLANGKIGKISVINGLPDGLTKEAISVAKQIKFKPAGNCWGFENKTATVTYTFSLN
ncbi:MAG TPA: TonB family protein [Pyrinomonadaceae bacterium]|nr:TonB family protein [Pyrinomonadaceae bacterium]